MDEKGSGWASRALRVDADLAVLVPKRKSPLSPLRRFVRGTPTPLALLIHKAEVVLSRARCYLSEGFCYEP